MSDSFSNYPGAAKTWRLPVANVASLPATANYLGDVRLVLDTETLYAWDGSAWSSVSGGGGGAVDSVNGQTGVVVLDKTDIGLDQVDNTSDANKPISTATQAALDLKQDLINGSNTYLIYKDGSGVVKDVPGFNIDPTSGGLFENVTNQPDDNAQSFDLNYKNLTLDPLQDSPDESWVLNNNRIEIDPNDTGFQIGTNGTAVRIAVNNIFHQGTSDLGAIEITQNNFSIGNGTDPIDVRGMGYIFGFGQFNANVNISNALQGYGFQFNVDPAATISNTTYVQGFYDAATIGCSSPNYTSFNGSPSIEEMQTNNNFNGCVINPTIDLFTGNSGFTGIGVFGQLGTFGTGSFNGINVNPNVDEVKSANGISVNMNNVTVYPGTVSSITMQDITITMLVPSSFTNTFTLEFIDDATAGSETATLVGTVIEVHIEAGVSTATQVKTALDAQVTITTNATITISGVGSNPQVAEGPSPFTGGTDPGYKRAIDAVGDVSITGSLTFSGALSIGQLQAFYQSNVVDGGGQPLSMHGLTTGLIGPNGVTTANIDAIGVNTAQLVTLEPNSINTSGAFKLGMAALALPCVVETHSGSSLDYMNMAVYAINLSGASTGGTIDRVNGARVEAIPNGITTINEFVAFEFNQTFGQVGTDVWGVHVVPSYAENHFGGSVNIGNSTRKVTNSDVGLELGAGRVFLNARLDSTAISALTGVNGMQVYNTTTDKLQVYAAGSWVDLH